ncbi:MAG: hypothetical protein COA78_27090 [Blastopirellula sp.]|nr:MAG: hypothetical protein COA78_27090 [Blastopirellula sp.]
MINEAIINELNFISIGFSPLVMTKSLLHTVRFHCFLLVFLLMATVGHAREWTSTDGKNIEAKFIRFESDNKVTLEYQGNEIKFDIDRFGAADKKYLDELREILLANQPKEPQPKSTGSDTDGPDADKSTAKLGGASASVALKARRIWRDRYGIAMTAKFVRMSQGTVLFSVPGGFRPISYHELCLADREFILEKYKAMGKEALVPFVREGYGDSENGGYDCCGYYDSYCGDGPCGGGPNSKSQNSGPGSSSDSVPGQEKNGAEGGTKKTPGSPLPPKVKLDIAPITENVLPATGFGAVAPKSKTVLPPSGFGAEPSDLTSTNVGETGEEKTGEDETGDSGLNLPAFDIAGENTGTGGFNGVPGDGVSSDGVSSDGVSSDGVSSDTPLDNGSSEDGVEIARNDASSDLASSNNAYVPKYTPKSKIDFSNRFNQTPAEGTGSVEPSTVKSSTGETQPSESYIPERSSNLFRDDMKDVSIPLVVLFLAVGVHLIGLVWLTIAGYSVNGVWGSTFLGLFLVRLPFGDSIVGIALSLVMFVAIVIFAVRNYEIAATPLYLYLASTLVVVLTVLSMQ